MKNNIKVIKDKNGWKMKKENTDEEKYFNTKEETIDYAKSIAKNDEVELIIHNENGIISNKNSYGNDPHPPKDKK